MAARATPGTICLSSPSRADAVFELAKAGDVAARSCQAGDEAGADRIDNDHEHDWHCVGRL
jgi:hypothetical protein